LVASEARLAITPHSWADALLVLATGSAAGRAVLIERNTLLTTVTIGAAAHSAAAVGVGCAGACVLAFSGGVVAGIARHANTCRLAIRSFSALFMERRCTDITACGTVQVK
jgi:hypothetical protein